MHQRHGGGGPTKGTARMNNKVTIQNINTRITKSGGGANSTCEGEMCKGQVLSQLWDVTIQEMKVVEAECSLSSCDVEHTELILEAILRVIQSRKDYN